MAELGPQVKGGDPAKTLGQALDRMRDIQEAARKAAQKAYTGPETPKAPGPAPGRPGAA